MLRFKIYFIKRELNSYHQLHLQAQVRPKCGRVVAFRSNGLENLHGVLGVRKGVRCALPLWFTLSTDKSEDGRAAEIRRLYKIKNGETKITKNTEL